MKISFHRWWWHMMANVFLSIILHFNMRNECLTNANPFIHSFIIQERLTTTLNLSSPLIHYYWQIPDGSSIHAYMIFFCFCNNHHNYRPNHQIQMSMKLSFFFVIINPHPHRHMTMNFFFVCFVSFDNLNNYKWWWWFVWLWWFCWWYRKKNRALKKILWPFNNDVHHHHWQHMCVKICLRFFFWFSQIRS